MTDTANETILNDGSASIVDATLNILNGLKPKTALETFDDITLGIDLITVAINHYKLLDSFPQAALTTAVAKLRMADAIANLADVLAKYKVDAMSPETYTQLVKAAGQAVGATGMWLEGLN